MRLDEESLVEVDRFKYLGSQVTANGGCERDVVHRKNEGYKALGALKSVQIGIRNKCEEVSIYEGINVPTAQTRRSAERRKVNVLEM